MRHPRVLFACLFLLTSACSNLNSAPNVITVEADTLPCWFENPVSEGRTGQIGLARNLYIGGKKPLVKSRERAYQKLATYLGISAKLPEMDVETQSVKLGSHTVYFTNDLELDGYVYSYAQLDNNNAISTQCPRSACSLSQCSPAWLCTASTDKELAQLGVSYLTSDPGKQYDRATDNALKLAQYQFGSHVEAQKRLVSLSGGSAQYNALRQSNSVEQLGFQNIEHIATQSCKKNNTLFTRIAFPGLSPLANTLAPNDKSWMTNPKYKGFEGAVGSVEKKVSSGLFSDQVNLAIKRAIVALALEQHSELSEEQLLIQYQSGGDLWVSTIKENTNLVLKASVLSFHVVEGSDDSVAVHVWVAKTN